MESEDGGARDNTASDESPKAPVPVPSNPIEQADRTGGQLVSSGVMSSVTRAVQNSRMRTNKVASCYKLKS